MENTALTTSFILKYMFRSKKSVYTYLYALSIVTLCTLISWILDPYLTESNLIMVYLLGVTIVALLGQVGPSIFVSILSVFAYDYFFIPPIFSFSVSDIQYSFALVVMLLVAQIISYLTILLRGHIEAARNVQSQIEKEHFQNILLTSVSHDLRTPLTAIMGSASSIIQVANKRHDEPYQELAQNIYDESERLNHLVNNILKIIKLETGSILLTKQLYAIDEIIESTIDQFKNQLTNKPISVQINKPVPLISLDYILIGQVFNNLIENAIKYTPAGSPIEISVEFQDPKNALVKIADRGPGIRPEEMQKIFDKFYRGQHPETSGIGLGLAICKEIILAHHGKIWAEPRNEGGAMICFTLPIAEDKNVNRK